MTLAGAPSPRPARARSRGGRAALVVAVLATCGGAARADRDAALSRFDAVWDGSDGRTSAIYRPRFASAATLLADSAAFRLQPLHPGVDWALEGRGRLLLTGPAASLLAVTETLGFLDVATPQVLVEVTLVETARRCRRESGGLAIFDRGAGGPNTFFRSIRADFEPRSWLRQQLVGERRFEGVDVRTADSSSAGDFDAVLRGLAHAGEADVLVRPTLLCSEGVPAAMESSLALPVSLFIRKGTLVSREHVTEKAGVRLEVTAERIGRDSVRLRLHPWVRRVEEASAEGGPLSYPVLGVREVSTTVEVSDGETIVAASLEGRRRVRLRSGFPALDRLPALDGALASRRGEDDVADLHLLVTARILSPGREPPAVVPGCEVDRCARARREPAR